MPRGPSLDERLIDFATSAPPPGREEWARAMRAEFEALEGPRTGWAIGCLATAAGWRLRTDWGFLVVLALIAGFSWHLTLLPVFWVFRAHLIPHDEGPVFAFARFLVPSALCLALAAARPRYWLLVGIGYPLCFVVVATVETAQRFHSQIWEVHPFNATLEVGTAALVGYCLVAALIGRGLGAGLAKPNSAVRVTSAGWSVSA